MTGNKQNGIVLQDRDRHLLQELAVMRVVDREQAKCVGRFGSTTRVNSRLLGLTRVGLLRRFFIGSDAVGKKALYTLSPKGAAFTGTSSQGLRRRRDELSVADIFVNHQLRINEIYCLAKYRPISIPDAKFVRWVSFSEPLTSGSLLIPDGYVEIATPRDFMAAFLEVDLGHESRSVWRTKMQSYLRYAVSGDFTKERNQPQFRTLVVTNSERRMNSLRVATSELTEKIFWFTTFDLIALEGFWSRIWQRSKNDERQALL
jgi:Replication-relaxation